MYKFRLICTQVLKSKEAQGGADIHNRVGGARRRGVERVTACLKPEAFWSGGSGAQKEQELNAFGKLPPLPSLDMTVKLFRW